MSERSELIHVNGWMAEGRTARRAVALRSSADISEAPTKEVRS